MKTKYFALIAPLLLAMVALGCVRTVDGHRQAGVPLVKDRIENRYERAVPEVVNAARVVLNRMGEVTVDNVVGNSFEARVNNRRVYVKVSEVDPNISQVIVQVRTRTGVSDIDLASNIATQIALQLAIQ